MNRFNNSILTNLVAITSETPAANITNNVMTSNSSTIANSIVKTLTKFTTNSSSITTTTTTSSDTCTNPLKSIQEDKSKRPHEAAAHILKQSNIVCFDVDSTVIREEGIDELAKFCGKGQEVAALTREAMKGSMTFQDALKMRLNIIRPSQKQIRDFLKAHPSTLSPGIKDLINRLKLNNIPVYLISGGFDCLIEPVAMELDIPQENVFANRLQFYFNGEYAGFDATQPTSRSGGKGEAISMLKRNAIAITSNTTTSPPPPPPPTMTTKNSTIRITMIGDGATDLEAAPPADHFIGYGGNIIRDEVRQRSQYYITDFQQISELL